MLAEIYGFSTATAHRYHRQGVDLLDPYSVGRHMLRDTNRRPSAAFRIVDRIDDISATIRVLTGKPRPAIESVAIAAFCEAMRPDSNL